VIYAYSVVNQPSEQTFANARSCLERSIAADRAFMSAHAALSFLLVSGYLNGIGARPGEDPLERALDAARTAVNLSPQLGRAHSANFWARFVNRRFDDAFESARTALQLNPYSSDTKARLGAANILRGQVDDGLKWLTSAQHSNANTPGWEEFFFFLAAYLNGDDQEAARHALRRSTAQLPLGQIARIIVLSKQGNAAGIAKWRGRLSTEFPEFSSHVSQFLDRWAMKPDIRDRLLADFEAAGAADVAHKAPP
jgi:tetratricopeptide (TPR) repeat protein